MPKGYAGRVKRRYPKLKKKTSRIGSSIQKTLSKYQKRRVANARRKRNISGELILINPDIRAKIQRLQSQAMKLQAERRKLMHAGVATDGTERKLHEVDRILQTIYTELKHLEKGIMKNNRKYRIELDDLRKRLRKLPRASKRVLIKSLRNRERRNQPDSIKIEGVDYKIVGEIPGQVTEIKYDRFGDTEHPGKYFHKFDTPTEILALNDGSIVIVPKNKKKLWEKI